MAMLILLCISDLSVCWWLEPEEKTLWDNECGMLPKHLFDPATCARLNLGTVDSSLLEKGLSLVTLFLVSSFLSEFSGTLDDLVNNSMPSVQVIHIVYQRIDLDILGQVWPVLLGRYGRGQREEGEGRGILQRQMAQCTMLCFNYWYIT